MRYGGTGSGSYSPGAPAHYKERKENDGRGRAEGGNSGAGEGKGPQGAIYEHLKQAQALVDDLGADTLERLDEAVAVLESHREWNDAGEEERPLPPRLLELFVPLTPLERGSSLRIATIVFALRGVRAADPQTLKE